MSECDVRFSSSSSTDAGTFKLLELPPDLCALIESAVDPGLTIKGAPDEDAVLCTPDKTYTLRSVVLSNSVLVLTSENEDVIIRDQLNEIMELAPAVPRLHKLSALLRGAEYDEGEEDSDTSKNIKRRRITYADAQAEIQASEAELAQGLRDRHILILNGELRPIAQAYLDNLLELLLTMLVALASPSAEDIAATLADEHAIPHTVSTQVMAWFGRIEAEIWKVDVESVVKAVGLGVLRHHKDEPISEDEFVTKWKTAVGDTFQSAVSLPLLSGNYLSVPTLTYPPVIALTYFPAAALPVDPAPRFAALFTARARWAHADLAPFLADAAPSAKERDKLLLKYARAVTDAEGVWYTARAKYNG